MNHQTRQEKCVTVLPINNVAIHRASTIKIGLKAKKKTRDFFRLELVGHLISVYLFFIIELLPIVWVWDDLVSRMNYKSREKIALIALF